MNNRGCPYPPHLFDKCLASNYHTSKVYFAKLSGEKGDCIKIGKSSCLVKRLTQVIRQYSVRVILLAVTPGGRIVERKMHERFILQNTRMLWPSSRKDPMPPRGKGGRPVTTRGEFFAMEEPLMSYIDSLQPYDAIVQVNAILENVAARWEAKYGPIF